ncbi:metallophosphoesterase [Cryptosporangium phraense]|uniref:Metallophosphoesterase n=1 Tax=Cryptosporangium phraense TaxID=2593070 RepID=A0A545B0P5_9ACTN|nr:metallophosphoesterase [Cryptosporangium phraense]
MFVGILIVVTLLLFGVPWWTLLGPQNEWPLAVVITGTVLVVAAAIGLPTAMLTGHARHSDGAARVGDTLLGVVWVLFVWSILGNVLGLVLLAAGVDDPGRSRIVAVATIVVSAALLIWGNYEAMRVPRVRELDVTIDRLGAGLDGTRVVLIADTHYGPIDRAPWSRKVAAVINDLDADVIAHAGDIADGTPYQREEQAAPLGTLEAKLAKVYVTGNHEYFNEAQGWLDRMTDLGWNSLHNRHVVVERGGDRLVVAGVDDVTAKGSGLPGHRTDLPKALDGADQNLPVLLLAHQPKFVKHAAEAGIDLMVSGHTHGGQMWPFNFLVRLDQPVVRGLSRHGATTQLYTSGGTGFWGPPFRVFAPSEITVLTLRR